jgi:hypothetical protein
MAEGTAETDPATLRPRSHQIFHEQGVPGRHENHQREKGRGRGGITLNTLLSDLKDPLTLQKELENAASIVGKPIKAVEVIQEEVNQDCYLR